ncbi:TRAP transporter substrate-binding protein [Hansschlegelia zhihuaiae]|uniref:TRAP transporter substrate-binding protein n=1 Tax=Hansschlegelia zhihuaiae TaxID=405005 RepID=A0A4Q0MGY7_9HYPH|nr:TRAP transporter substrate-binding protein [Hansschlegelia zhihuaiae]RXF72750.1 TRAP transporter substrate-binding protein [Hansschlegelia zhihuaiae]
MKKSPDTLADGGEASSPARRRFLAGAAVATAATVAAPAVVRAQAAVRLKFQSTWPNKDIFHEFASDFVKRVNEMGAGRIQIELLQAGAVVPAFQLLDAVSTGVLDGGHGVSAYWYGKNKAFSLFGTAPPFGWNANQLLSWVKYGGGQALYDELTQQVLKLNVVGLLTGPMPTQPFGWFKKEIAGPDAIKGLKYRTVGLGADLGKEMGMAVTILPGGEIVPAIDRGLIDGAEFNNPSSDKILGFPDVSKIYMVQSYHQTLECFEILFNKRKFEGLPAEVQAIVRYASEAASADMSWKAQDRYSKDLEAIKAAGVKVIETPKSILEAQLAAWDKVIAANPDPFFQKVIESQKSFAKRVVGMTREMEAPRDLAYEHFFKQA